MGAARKQSRSARGRSSDADRRARHDAIVNFISETGGRTVEEISIFAGVSPMTVYRDINDLQTNGLLHLERGVVTAAASTLHEASSRYRLTRDTAAKERLAAAAIGLVEPGQSIMMDDSTTGVFLARLLPSRAPLTVVTNFHPVALALVEEPQIQVIVTGGEHQTWADALFGSLTTTAIRSMRADILFMSSSAITDGYCFHPTQEPAEVKRAMIASSRLRVLYVDNSKFTRTALHQVCPVSEFDIVIVDKTLEKQHLAQLKELGPKIIRA
ncbi:MAG: DeoR/GlpR family DNA-binding transcription regulator [Propionibacteriaceae bacterium]|jgi:DeoR/GlpR family transcriptional regulator of sugar metabolism|nr:DeoR/GlpR family DNA-binding transcription regulator [Propionibacteriaceae bacterium]